MIDFVGTFQNKLRFAAVGALVVACLLLLPFLPHLLWIDSNVQAASGHSSNTENTSLNDSPNAITRGMFNGADGLEQVASSTEQTISNSFRSAASTIASTATKSGKFVAHSVGTAATATAEAAGNSMSFIAQGTGKVISTIADTSVVGAVIRPADSDKTLAPVIDPNSFSPTDSKVTEDTNRNASQPLYDSEASWPIRGVITTGFGVPHRPWQPVHTGLDISDQQPSGVTPIKPFKPGIVIDTVRLKVGLGNHVIVDHGGGITSVYAHLASISVRVGQTVDKSTILGYEGSTGASTGTHLHFEIRLNNQPVDPREYITGQPRPS